MRILLFVSVLAILACMGALIVTLVASSRPKKRYERTQEAWKN